MPDDDDVVAEVRKLAAQLRMAMRDYANEVLQVVQDQVHDEVLQVVEEEVHDQATLERIRDRLQWLSKREPNGYADEPVS